MKSHKPVLLDEVVEALKVKELVHLKNEVKMIDATLGMAGHTLRLIQEGACVLGIDADKSMLAAARERLEEVTKTRPTPESGGMRFRGSYKLVHGSFRKIDVIAKTNDFDRVDGVLFDLGVATPQLTSPERGFSFRDVGAELDMRIDKNTQAVEAKDLLNSLREDQLIDLFEKTLTYTLSRKLAERLIRQREEKEFRRVGDFLKVVKGIIPRKGKLDPATLPFLALRMAVNSEIENLEEALPLAWNLLVRGGRMVVISFHSGEDKVLKEFSKEFLSRGILKIVTKKPIRPSKDEIAGNPSARSAKMRVFENI